MKFLLEIDCDSAAFEDHPADEVAWVLRRLMDTPAGFSHRNLAVADPIVRTVDNPFVLFDANGVSVGTAYFTEHSTPEPEAVSWVVETTYNTDADGKWVAEDDWSNRTFHGPFLTQQAAEDYMEWFLEDDTDVKDMHTSFVNAPLVKEAP